MAKKKKSKDKVLNDRPRKIFRKIIPSGEVVFGVFFIGFVLFMGIWFATRRDAFDPAERDISMEVMIAQSVEDHLYEPPLKRWVDPAFGSTSGGPVALDIGIFPSSILTDGWEAASRVQEFDSSNLYEKINGQETQYKAYGFQYLHYLSVANPANDVEVSIELYDMGTFENALGVFAAQRSEGSRVDRSELSYYYLTEVGVLGIADNYYFKVTGSDTADVINQFSLRFVNEIQTINSESSTTPDTFLLLSQGLGITFQNIEFVKEDVFQYAFAKDFWFGKTDEETPVRYYVHQAADAQEAQLLFDKLLEEQLYEYTLVEQDGKNVLLKHDFLKIYSTLNQFGSFVYGLEGAKDTVRAEEALGVFQALFAKSDTPEE